MTMTLYLKLGMVEGALDPTPVTGHKVAPFRGIAPSPGKGMIVKPKS